MILTLRVTPISLTLKFDELDHFWKKIESEPAHGMLLFLNLYQREVFDEVTLRKKSNIIPIEC